MFGGAAGAEHVEPEDDVVPARVEQPVAVEVGRGEELGPVGAADGEVFDRWRSVASGGARLPAAERLRYVRAAPQTGK